MATLFGTFENRGPYNEIKYDKLEEMKIIKMGMGISKDKTFSISLLLKLKL